MVPMFQNLFYCDLLIKTSLTRIIYICIYIYIWFLQHLVTSDKGFTSRR